MARGLSVVFRRQPTRLSRLVFNAALRIGRHFEQEERNVVQSNREPGTTRVPTPWPGEAPGISACRSVASLLLLDYNQAGTRNLKDPSITCHVPCPPVSSKPTYLL